MSTPSTLADKTSARPTPGQALTFIAVAIVVGVLMCASFLAEIERNRNNDAVEKFCPAGKIHHGFTSYKPFLPKLSCEVQMPQAPAP